MADWSRYFPNISFYIHQTGDFYYTSGAPLRYLIKRTPIFSLVNSFYLSFNGNHFYNYQTVCTFINTLLFLVILPGCFIAVLLFTFSLGFPSMKHIGNKISTKLREFNPKTFISSAYVIVKVEEFYLLKWNDKYCKGAMVRK